MQIAPVFLSELTQVPQLTSKMQNFQWFKYLSLTVTDGKRGEKANVVKTALLKSQVGRFIMRVYFYDEFDERSVARIMITGLWSSACGQSAARDSEWWLRWERFPG